MPESHQHRKRIRHFHEPGDLHELTFSCYQRLPLLTNNSWRTNLSRAIDAAGEQIGCHLAAFVYMPEHVHLLVWGLSSKEQVSELLSAIKQPVSVAAHEDLLERPGRMLDRLMVRERPGRTVFRFWQEGPGFDRNLFTVKAATAALDYLHLNPVKRGLCQKARDWRWSSARFYEHEGQFADPLLPKIKPLPAEFWMQMK
jgi:putative transposase